MIVVPAKRAKLPASATAGMCTKPIEGDEVGETVGGKAVGKEAGKVLVVTAGRVTAWRIREAEGVGVAGNAYGAQPARKTIARRRVVFFMIMS